MISTHLSICIVQMGCYSGQPLKVHSHGTIVVTRGYVGSQWKRPRTVCKTDYDDTVLDALGTSFYPKHCDQFSYISVYNCTRCLQMLFVSDGLIT